MSRSARNWTILGLVCVVGFTADWWFFERCPAAEEPPSLLFETEWIDGPDPRLVATGAADEVLALSLARDQEFVEWRPSLREVELVSVSAVHRLILRTEFGVEEVELAGLGGPEDWLPEEAREYLEQTGRQELETHLRAAGNQLYEVRSTIPGLLPWATVSSSDFRWPARGWSGRRLVQLVVNPEQATHDVAATAVTAGWTYSAPPFSRPDALYPAALHMGVPADQPGFHALACFVGERQQLSQSLAQWSALSEDELTRRGRAVAEVFAPALPGLNPANLQFLTTGKSGMRRELRRLQQWMGGGTTAREDHLHTCAEVEGVLAVSLPAGRIWVRTDEPAPIELLDWVLGHEIIHQYQHLQGWRFPEHGHAFDAYPDPLSEAHAEGLNLIVQRELNPELPAASGGFAYEESVARVQEEAAALGRPLSEYLEEILQAYPEAVHAGYESARPESMVLLHGAGSEWRGLAFAPQRGADGDLEVKITNLADAPVVTRFTGQWKARLSQPRKQRVMTPDDRYEVQTILDSVSTPPFVLELPPRATVTIRLGRNATWMDEWTAFLGCHDPIELSPDPAR